MPCVQVPVTLEWVDGKSVSVAGTFSNWEPVPLSMRSASPSHLSLPPLPHLSPSPLSLPLSTSPSVLCTVVAPPPSPGGVYEGAIDLPSEGSFQYKFVVDGTWTHNPNQVLEWHRDRAACAVALLGIFTLTPELPTAQSGGRIRWL